MKIYTARHGQTDWNKIDVILGTTDIELNETGIMQANELAEKIAELDDIDVMVVSPMKRAVKTAEIISKRTGLEIITDERLREWDYGDYEGRSRFSDGFDENKVNFAVKMGKNGESLLQLAHRVYSVLDDVIGKYRGKNVLLVCHGGICRIIETYFQDLTTQEFASWFAMNCELNVYNIE